jgi:hypothetical protein
MTPKASQRANPKKNKGGRPRKNAKGTTGSGSITWKRVSQPVSTNNYEVSSRGEVRRALKGGGYYDLKPWITGGPYAAVYLYGVKGATRNRKKVYVHRLVANHFVGGKKKGNVVHHTVSPASNTRSTLEWVTPSENQKARKFFTDDGKRRKKLEKPVKLNVPSPPEPKLAASAPPKSASPPKAVPKVQKYVKPKPKKILPKKPKPKKILPKPEGAPPAPPPTKLPSIDPEDYHPAQNWPFAKKLNWLLKKVPELKAAYKKFRKEMPMVTRQNMLEKYKEATDGKALEKKITGGPKNWKTVILSAFYAIRLKLKV